MHIMTTEHTTHDQHGLKGIYALSELTSLGHFHWHTIRKGATPLLSAGSHTTVVDIIGVQVVCGVGSGRGIEEAGSPREDICNVDGVC